MATISFEGETHGELVVKVRRWLASTEGAEEGALTPHEAIELVQARVEEILAEMDPPKSLTDHTYSGQFTVRTSPELHERLTVEAAEQGVSMNQWVAYKLAGRRIPTLDDLF